MKKILSLVIILSCAFTSVSWADGPGGNDRGQQQVWQNNSGRGGPDGNRQQGPGNGSQANNHQGDGDNRGENGRGGSGDRIARDNRHQERHEQDHFAWNGHNFRKGQPVPQRFRGNDYRVVDWNDRGLPPPPSGQHWSYIDGNYVLIAAATGIITSILINGALGH